MSANDQSRFNPEAKNRFLRRDNLVVLAYFLLVGSFFIQAFALWHSQMVDLLREQYRERYGAIEVNAALYFDGMALSVGIPTFLIWFVLQIGSAVAFCCNWRRISYPAVLIYLV